jgi:hypothetical protein
MCFFGYIPPFKPREGLYSMGFRRKKHMTIDHRRSTIDNQTAGTGLCMERYIAIRPHEALEGLSPNQFAAAGG